ncbi:MAG: hypothetical protein ACPL68_08225, partial [Candidatus Hydrothermia bacterium]
MTTITLAFLFSANNIVVEKFQVIGADTSLAPVAAELLRGSLAAVAGHINGAQSQSVKFWTLLAYCGLFPAVLCTALWR